LSDKPSLADQYDQNDQIYGGPQRAAGHKGDLYRKTELPDPLQYFDHLLWRVSLADKTIYTCGERAPT
jgi:hypothetical protein